MENETIPQEQVMHLPKYLIAMFIVSIVLSLIAIGLSLASIIYSLEEPLMEEDVQVTIDEGVADQDLAEDTDETESQTNQGMVTYSNDEYGFTFEYPSDWQLTQYDAEMEHGRVVSITSDEVEEIDSILPKINFDVYFWEDINNKYAQAGESSESRFDYENLDEFLNDDSYIRLVNSSGRTTLDGYDAYEVIVGGHGAYFAVMVETEDGLYQLLFPRASAESDLTEEDMAIIDSFEFIDQLK